MVMDTSTKCNMDLFEFLFEQTACEDIYTIEKKLFSIIKYKNMNTDFILDEIKELLLVLGNGMGPRVLPTCLTCTLPLSCALSPNI